jgi:hypothetical protein
MPGFLGTGMAPDFLEATAGASCMDYVVDDKGLKVTISARF